MLNVKYIKDNLTKIISENQNFYMHNDIIIVGTNSSGKSWIIKETIKELLKKDFNKIYFIDSTNRNIVSTTSFDIGDFDKCNINNIINERVDKKNFNKNDVFEKDYGREIVLNEIKNKEEHYMNLFKEILNIDLFISRPNESNGIEDMIVNEERVLINNECIDNISDGLQGMMRILMEVDFAHNNDVKTIFIDEFDMNLDHKNSSMFIELLKSKYSDIRFIITCHSIYTILGVRDFDIVKIIKCYDDIRNNLCEKFDCNELNNIEIIDRKLFGEIIKRDEIDVLLSDIIKNLICDISISDGMIEKFKKLSNLTPRQRLLYKYIERRL